MAALPPDADRLERELDRFFSSSLDLMVVASLEGYFRKVSPSWTAALGWTAEELTSRPWLDFVHPDDRDRTIAEAEKQKQGASVLTFENRYRARDGGYRWLWWRVPSPTPGSDLLYATARDVTDLKRAEEEIRRLNRELEARVRDAETANRELEAFAYSVSHDLRAPLRAIDGFSRILQEDHATSLDGEGRRVLDVVRFHALRMAELIDDLLHFSRLGRQALDRTAVDMTDLARGVVADLRAAAPDRAVEVVLGDLPAVRGDRAMLRQVWVNLAGNAFKYTRPRPAARVEIEGERTEGGAVFRVRDNGVGFDMRYADKLFSVFQRLHRPEEFEGTGVGLAIVQRIVQRHGGRVEAEGRVGEGATIRFTIPD